MFYIYFAVGVLTTLLALAIGVLTALGLFPTFVGVTLFVFLGLSVVLLDRYTSRLDIEALL